MCKTWKIKLYIDNIHSMHLFLQHLKIIVPFLDVSGNGPIFFREAGHSVFGMYGRVRFLTEQTQRRCRRSNSDGHLSEGALHQYLRRKRRARQDWAEGKSSHPRSPRDSFTATQGPARAAVGHQKWSRVWARGLDFYVLVLTNHWILGEAVFFQIEAALQKELKTEGYLLLQ